MDYRTGLSIVAALRQVIQAEVAELAPVVVRRPAPRDEPMTAPAPPVHAAGV
jgi:hypothetical protein